MHYILEASVDCPWCGETFPTSIDTSQGDHEHIEDCAVCCSPISIQVECEPGEIFSLQAERP